MRIVFLPVPSGKPWNGATIYNEPLGGSEAAVAYMARSLSRLGHIVTVYTHGPSGVFDGVLYTQYGDQLPHLRNDVDVVVVSRWLQILDYLPKNLFKVLWLHDMPHELPDHITVNAVFTVSEFQAKAWHLPTEYTWVTSDGVDTSLFHPSTGPTDPTKLVWLSNPDRGLAVAARIFQDLRKRWPDLKLHVYGRSAVYGWSPAVEQPYLPAPDFMEGVILHEPLARAALADAIRDAFAMFYPTFWPETFCMAALEAQACGVPVICSDAGALSETVQGGIVGNDFLNAFSQLRNPTRWEKLSKRGLQFAEAHEWDNVAAGWVETFCAMRGVPCA